MMIFLGRARGRVSRFSSSFNTIFVHRNIPKCRFYASIAPETQHNTNTIPFKSSDDSFKDHSKCQSDTDLLHIMRSILQSSSFDSEEKINHVRALYTHARLSLNIYLSTSFYFRLSEQIINHIINVREANKLNDDMETRKLLPEKRLMINLVNDFTTSGYSFSHSFALLLIDYFTRIAFNPSLVDHVLKNIQDDTWSSQLIETAGECFLKDVTGKSYPRIIALWKKLPELGIAPTPEIYKILLFAYAKNEEYDKAESIYGQYKLQERNLQFKSDDMKLRSVMNFKMMQIYCELNQKDKVEELLKNLKDDEQVDIFIYRTMMWRAIADNDFERIEALYTEVKDSGLNWHSTFVEQMVKAYEVMKQEDRIKDLLQDAENRDVELDGRVFNAIIRVYGTNMERMNRILESMSKYKIQMNDEIYASMLRSLADNGNIPDMLEFWNRIKSGNIHIKPTIALFNTVLKLHAIHGIHHSAWKVMIDLEASGLQPDKYTHIWMAKISFKTGNRNRLSNLLTRIENDFDEEPAMNSKLARKV